MSANLSIKKKTIDPMKSSDDEIVSKCLTNYKKLNPLKDNLIALIATLEDRFIREVICLAALSLLRSRACYEQFMKKIRDFATDKSSIPRSLRVKVELSPAMPNSVRRQKYMAAEEKAKETVEKFQKSFRSHFIEVKECDRDEAYEAHTGNYFKLFIQILDAKFCYTLAKSTHQIQKVFNNNDRNLSATAVLKIFEDYEKNKKEENTIELLEENTEKETSNPIAIAINAQSTTLTDSNATTDTIDKADEEQKEATDNGPHWIDELSKYLNLPSTEIKEKTLKDLLEDSNGMTEAKLLQNLSGKVKTETTVSLITNFISSITPAITTKLIDTYNESLKELKAQHLALRRIKEAKIKTVTEDVHKAIAEEPSMDPKNMKSLMHKVVDKRMNQNEKEADTKRKRAKNLKGEKKVSFSIAQKPTNNNPTKPLLNQTNKKKRKAQKKHPKHKSRTNASQQTQQKEQNQQQNNKKRRKTYKSKKWVRPKLSKDGHQDA